VLFYQQWQMQVVGCGGFVVDCGGFSVFGIPNDHGGELEGELLIKRIFEPLILLI